MPWVINLCKHQTWANEIISALCAARLGLEVLDAPASGSTTGIIFAGLDSQDLTAVLGAAEYNRCRVMVIGPPDGRLKPWPVLEAGAAECITWHGQVGHSAAPATGARRKLNSNPNPLYSC